MEMFSFENKWSTIGLIHHGKGWKQRANKRIINLSLKEICIVSVMLVAMDSMLMVGRTMEMETSLLEDMLKLVALLPRSSEIQSFVGSIHPPLPFFPILTSNANCYISLKVLEHSTSSLSAYDHPSD
ncbi:hypothetical protein M9H77_29496 [Catharanthus roseus]|uniref:Uncharacterized protein n=1 Tax=Catharanthus roseus TaxID=4058 RepID=A0ACB9ZVD4_CATRO|nr:hypothetical protein M9H77_29496 [Catharanthus roseus]